MRYIDWDVLLFPEGSKIPLQEYKTGCFVTQDLDQGQLPNPIAPSSAYTIDHAAIRQLPVVACFVPNLPHECPFRVSLHSWTPPFANRNTYDVAPHNDSVYFEARVLLDGVCVAGILFDQQAPWPKVIDLDKSGDPDSLRFPPFHQEMLTQNWWSAAENLGRIKVIIAEGFVQSHSVSPFTRTRNIVSFSFQHAPLDVLESSGIAWPNSGMWYQTSQPVYSVSSPLKSDVADSDAHGHSPRRRSGSRESKHSSAAPAMPPLYPYRCIAPPSTLSREPCLMDPYCSSLPMPDPFVDSDRFQLYKKWAPRTGSEDQPMPDYSHSITPASSRNISDEMAQATQRLNQCKESTGTFTPANARVSSAANTPPIQLRPSAAADARASSYSHIRSVSVTTRDPPPPEVRASSESSLKLRCLEDQAESNERLDTKIQKKPAGDVKSRKEGKLGEIEMPPKKQKRSSIASTKSFEKENIKGSEDRPIAISSDSKRKRANSSTAAKSLILQEAGGKRSSPSRKVSKTEREESSSRCMLDDLTEQGVTVRPPLGPLDNVQ